MVDYNYAVARAVASLESDGQSLIDCANARLVQFQKTHAVKSCQLQTQKDHKMDRCFGNYSTRSFTSTVFLLPTLKR